MKMILVVDDNASNRVLAGAILKRIGYDFDEACSGEDAVNLATIKAYDVILMDISMPGLDGIEAMRKIRAETTVNAQTPIIAVTAHGTAQDKKRFLEYGFDGFSPKPITVDSLSDAITQASPAHLTSASKNTAVKPASNALDHKVIGQYAELMGSENAMSLLKSTWADIAEDIRVFEEAVAAGAAQDELAKQAHEIKGASGGVGAAAVSGAANVLYALVADRQLTREDLKDLRYFTDATFDAFAALDTGRRQTA